MWCDAAARSAGADGARRVDAAFLRLFDGVDHLLQILHRSPPSRTSPIATASSTVVMRLPPSARRGCSSPNGRASRLRARGEEFIEVVGMQLNQAGYSQPPSPSIASGRRLWLSAKGGFRHPAPPANRVPLRFPAPFDVIDNHAEAPIGCKRSATSYVRLRHGRCRRWPRHGFWLPNQLDYGGAVFGVQRGGRFVSSRMG